MQMKTVMVHIHDDSKFQLFVNFLKEINFVQIEEISSSAAKKMTELPKSMLNPQRVKKLKMFSRDELHDR